MSNDFGTVSVRRGERSREIEVRRQLYIRHRESLAILAADAPTEHLSSEYQRLIKEIDTAIGKLAELDGRTPADTQPMKTGPGTRPLMSPPVVMSSDIPAENAAPGATMPRVAMIIVAGLIVLAIIGWLMWRASGERTAATVPTNTTPVVETAPPVITPAPKPVVPPRLTIDPTANDYGQIRKGTRAVRQFQVLNNGDEPLAVQVSRSKCRCLYYDYHNPVPAHGKETITVTVDGAKAKSGSLHESPNVTAKKDSSARASFEVTATIK